MSSNMSSKTLSSNMSSEASSIPSENSPNLSNNQAGVVDNTAQNEPDSQSTLANHTIEGKAMEDKANSMPSSAIENSESSQLSSMADYEAESELEDFDEDEEESSDNQILEVHAEHIVTKDEAGQRIDKLAAELFADHSRAQLQEWMKSGNLTINGSVEKPKYRVKADDSLLLQAKLEQHGNDQPEDIALDIVYEDDSVLVVNKPVGMVVHPGAGNWTGTLVNGLLFHYPNQAHLPRAGLVHRIDKNTSGLLVIGKTKAAQLELQEQLKDKSVYRHYQCIVAGDAASLARQRTIDAPIGRHRTQRTKMTVTSMGKPAVTHIMTITPLNENYSLLDVQLETGRTHQIRVHLSHIGHPIIGDDVYGNRQQLRAGLTQEQRDAIQNFPRQALHAYQLGFIHPETGEDIEVTAPLPDDIVALAEILSE
ncbi:Ribosomal large subunit pseudouridine synthase D [Psychrobacter piechaudii]|uniref:Ribosomal large subunit pseudouridine synthase D n=2 Tax=Psychrobacter piechaudii TaxID=1945521 RepID=A0A1R4GWA4_9GAMM|nr:Ribosomal large subunit pseudouridine synthase D [Psychrobacter piechaudii]